jgi:hypothetical protein
LAPAPNLVLDDRLLIEELLAGLEVEGHRHPRPTGTTELCRSSPEPGATSPVRPRPRREPTAAVRSLLALPDTIGLPDPRSTVPTMAELSDRHPRLNVLNLEAAATGLVLDATVLLSAEASRGVLPGVLDAEGIEWRIVEI